MFCFLEIYPGLFFSFRILTASEDKHICWSQGIVGSSQAGTSSPPPDLHSVRAFGALLLWDRFPWSEGLRLGKSPPWSLKLPQARGVVPRTCMPGFRQTPNQNAQVHWFRSVVSLSRGWVGFSGAVAAGFAGHRLGAMLQRGCWVLRRALILSSSWCVTAVFLAGVWQRNRKA